MTRGGATKGKGIIGKFQRRAAIMVACTLGAAAFGGIAAMSAETSAVPKTIATAPDMPPVVDPDNLYSETAAGRLSAAVRDDFRAYTCPICARATST